MSDAAAILPTDPVPADYAKCVRIVGGTPGGTPVLVSPTGAVAFPISFPLAGPTAGSPARIAANIANVTLQALNGNRAKLIISNGASSNLYVKYGATASLAAGNESYTVKIPPGQTWIEDDPGIYRGIVDGIWDAADANGEALVTEMEY